MSARTRAVTRRQGVAAVLVAAAALLSLLSLVDALEVAGPAADDPARRDATRDNPLEGLEGLDQDQDECAEPAAREGQPRDADVSRPTDPLPVSSADLTTCPEQWDGELVRMVGEVVGVVLNRDGRTWAQLNDDAQAGMIGRPPVSPHLRGNAGIGFVADDEVAADVLTVGGPDAHGDIVEVEGTFRRVHATGEVAVIDLESLVVLRSGGPLERTAPAGRMPAAIAAVGMATVIALARLRGRR